MFTAVLIGAVLIAGVLAIDWLCWRLIKRIVWTLLKSIEPIRWRRDRYQSQATPERYRRLRRNRGVGQTSRGPSDKGM